jgi:hypothetical protein
MGTPLGAVDQSAADLQVLNEADEVSIENN